MKAIKFLALVAVAASLGAPAHAEGYVIAVKRADGSEVKSFGAWDNPRLRCQNGSRTVSFRLCNRDLYACESFLSSARNDMVKNQGFFEVRYSHRPGRPKAC